MCGTADHPDRRRRPRWNRGSSLGTSIRWIGNLWSGLDGRFGCFTWLLGGGLGYAAINSIAQDNYTKSNAQMQEVVASNNLATVQQAVLSQDAQAGALIKAGKDANDAASATINAAIKGIAAGKYKDRADVQDQLSITEQGMQDVAKATEALKSAVGQKARKNHNRKRHLERQLKRSKGMKKTYARNRQNRSPRRRKAANGDLEQTCTRVGT